MGNDNEPHDDESTKVGRTHQRGGLTAIETTFASSEQQRKVTAIHTTVQALL
jgi:hypothetical protein